MSEAVALPPLAAAARAPATPELITLHSLGWLVVGSAVGLLMALLLLVPELGALLAPLGYGRLAPLHLDLLLYGWCALPLIGLLLRLYGSEAGGGSRLALAAWSGALAAGAASWLAGTTSGKLFLDWAGPARWLFLATLGFLAGVLALDLLRSWGDRRRSERWLLLLVWVLLAGIPPGLWLATEARTYPPINPASGGPTGVSLLGSALVLVWVFLLTPWALGRSLSCHRRATALYAGAAGAHTAAFLLAGHSDQAHTHPLQLVALFSLLPWVYGVPVYLRRFAWSATERRWLRSFLIWAAALLASGLGAFVPGVLEAVKFTNVLVAHAHLAMAGMATSFAALVLAALNRDGRLAALFDDGAAFALWHGGMIVQVAALTAVGALEASNAAILFRAAPAVALLYLVRALAGAAMLTAALRWSGRAVQELT